MYEKTVEKYCFSRVREGPGAQVGATWVQKSRPKGSGRAKGASDRAAGGVRTVIWRSLGRLYNKSCNFLKCMKNLRKSMVFEGSERRPSWSDLGPKVAPERGQDSQNDVEQGRRRGQSSKSEGGRVRLSVGAMGTATTQPEIRQVQSQSLSKRSFI